MSVLLLRSLNKELSLHLHVYYCELLHYYYRKINLDFFVKIFKLQYILM